MWPFNTGDPIDRFDCTSYVIQCTDITVKKTFLLQSSVIIRSRWTQLEHMYSGTGYPPPLFFSSKLRKNCMVSFSYYFQFNYTLIWYMYISSQNDNNNWRIHAIVRRFEKRGSYPVPEYLWIRGYVQTNPWQANENVADKISTSPYELLFLR